MQKVIAYQDRAGEWRRSSREGGGRKDGCGLGVACQKATSSLDTRAHDVIGRGFGRGG
jgi:hypothetical protein